MLNVEKLRAVISSKLADWAKALPDPDRPLIGLADATKVLSARDLAREIKEGTQFGEALLQRWIELAIEREAAADLGVQHPATAPLAHREVGT